MPLLAEIPGRMADIIRTPDGRVVPGNGLMGAFHGIANVKRSQVVQERLDHVVINLQREDPTRDVDTTELRENLTHCLGTSVQIEFRTVDEIETAGRGKYRWVVSHLPAGQ
jgi:phenylacetate-CoA ligase